MDRLRLSYCQNLAENGKFTNFMTNRIFGSGKKEEYVMLTQEQKETMIAALRGKSVAKENITEEYKKNVRKK